MTVEERARIALEKFHHSSRIKDGLKAIEQALRDQIEDCAKVAEDQVIAHSQGKPPIEIQDAEVLHVMLVARQISDQIRALATPKEEKEGER